VMMRDLIRKILLTSVGAALLTREKIEEVVSELINQGEISNEEGVGLTQEMVKRANAERKRLEFKVHEEIRRNMVNSGLATEVELNQLRQEIVLLRQRVVELENKAVPGE
jgi:polyhydroxyalkanoate synthesis regulator phasin